MMRCTDVTVKSHIADASMWSGLRPLENYRLPCAYLQESHTCSIVLCARLLSSSTPIGQKKCEKSR